MNECIYAFVNRKPTALLTLQALELPKRHVFWDIGSCTGSVSIEAHLQFPHLQVIAFEIRPECEACTALGLTQEPPLRIQLNDYNPIEILKATQKI